MSTFGESDWPIEVTSDQPEVAIQAKVLELTIPQLLAVQGDEWRQARVELYERFALPFACLVFALLAVPLSVRPHRGGRAVGFLISVVLVLGYYLLFVIGSGFAKQGKIPPALGVWTPNLVMGLFGLALLPSLERIHGETFAARAFQVISSWLGSIFSRKKNPTPGGEWQWRYDKTTSYRSARAVWRSSKPTETQSRISAADGFLSFKKFSILFFRCGGELHFSIGSVRVLRIAG